MEKEAHPDSRKKGDRSYNPTIRRLTVLEDCMKVATKDLMNRRRTRKATLKEWACNSPAAGIFNTKIRFY